VGVFGILAIQVSERRREIAIRIALGADKSAVRLSILKGLRVPILIGIFLGSLISVPSAMALANSFSLSLAVVMCIYLASVFVLLGIVFAAAAIPTWRALAVPPTECLLAE
jgi:ABC-type antimicrobial peptide transport system permease subunit